MRFKKLVKRVVCAGFSLSETVFEACYQRRIRQAVLSQPIIVLGPDRSGTSMVYSLLGNHPKVYGPTTAADRFPEFPLSATFLRKIFSKGGEEHFSAVPNTNGIIQGGRDPLSEAVRYWVHHLGSVNGGWSKAPDDYFSEQDLDEVTRHTLPLDLKKRMVLMNKNRVVMKQPGFSLKVRYLDALFPDAIFVHCLRHPVDNFHSLLVQKAEHNNPNFGVRIPGWRQFCHLSLEAQTAHQLAGTHDIILQSIRQLDDSAGRYLPVRYESFSTDFAAEVQKLFQGCKLDVPAAIMEHPEDYVRPGGSRRKPKPPPADPAAREILEQLALRMGYPAEKSNKPA